MDGGHALAMRRQVPHKKRFLRMLDGVVKATAVRVQSGYCGRLSLDVVLGLGFLKICHMQAWQIQDVDGHRAKTRK